MGRGDTKTTKGKISKGSHGNSRPKHKKKTGPKKATETSSSSSTSR